MTTGVDMYLSNVGDGLEAEGCGPAEVMDQYRH